MSETVNTTHREAQSTCLTYMYVLPQTTTCKYYKSMPFLVFTPVGETIWLLCIGVRRAKSGPISSAIYLRAVFMQLLGASACTQQRLALALLDALACDVTLQNMPSCSTASLRRSCRVSRAQICENRPGLLPQRSVTAIGFKGQRNNHRGGGRRPGFEARYIIHVHFQSDPNAGSSTKTRR